MVSVSDEAVRAFIKAYNSADDGSVEVILDCVAEKAGIAAVLALAARDLAALFRQFAAEEQHLIDKRGGHPVPGSIRQVVLAETWTKAAGIVEQRLGGEP